VAAGAAPATSGFIAYDSTNNNFHGGLSSADSKFANFTATPAANNNCVKWLVSGSNYLLGDAGAACGTGAGANPQLSNLSGTVAINLSLVPGAVNSVALGSATLPFTNLYLGTVANQAASFDTSALSANRSVTIPNAASTTVQSDTGASNNFLTAISASGVISKAQPTLANLAGGSAGANSYDFTGASITRPLRRLAFASFPGTCTALTDFLTRSDPATAGQAVYLCNSAGTGWDLVGDGGGGGGANTALSNLTSPTAFNQHLLAGTDNTFDFGATGASRVRTAYLGTSLEVQGSGAGAMKLWNSAHTYYISFGAPASFGANVPWIWPSTDSVGCFRSDGSGTVTIITCGGGAVLRTLSWFFPGTVAAGVQTVRALVPEGATSCLLTNSRISVNTTGSTASTWNIARCTTAAGDCTATSNIYTSAVTLNSSTQSVAGGTPNTTTVSAGDAFKVNLVSVGTGLGDVTVALSYTCTN
jgi:hypothetical protein